MFGVLSSRLELEDRCVGWKRDGRLVGSAADRTNWRAAVRISAFVYDGDASFPRERLTASLSWLVPVVSVNTYCSPAARIALLSPIVGWGVRFVPLKSGR